MSNFDPFIQKALAAIHDQDFETLEGLRDHVRPAHIPALVSTWSPTLAWSVKAGYVHLLCDQTDKALAPLMADALNAPDAETQAAALCVLTGNFKQFDSFLVQGGVDPARVRAAVTQYRAGKG